MVRSQEEKGKWRAEPELETASESGVAGSPLDTSASEFTGVDRTKLEEASHLALVP